MGESLPPRIVFMGTPRFAEVVLSALIEKGLKPLAVFTQADKTGGRGHQTIQPPVKTIAESFQIRVCQPKKVRDEETIELLKSFRPDFIVVAAYGKILPKAVLEIPVYCCLNVHASLLPRWRGASPIQHAMLGGDKTTGVTIMKMEEGLDTGPVFLKSREISIEAEDNTLSLGEKLSAEGAVLIAEAMEKILKGEIVPVPQDDALATFAPRIKKEDGLISFEKRADEIRNMVKAFDPWPKAHFFIGGQRINVLEAEEGPAVDGKACGEVLPSKRLWISSAQPTTVYFNKIQREGKKVVSSEEFLRGFKIEPGFRF
jgi:methionyl-tRNA formyltransferase